MAIKWLANACLAELIMINRAKHIIWFHVIWFQTLNNSSSERHINTEMTDQWYLWYKPTTLKSDSRPNLSMRLAVSSHGQERGQSRGAYQSKEWKATTNDIEFQHFTLGLKINSTARALTSIRLSFEPAQNTISTSHAKTINWSSLRNKFHLYRDANWLKWRRLRKRIVSSCNEMTL
jgi:hypothetical protein